MSSVRFLFGRARGPLTTFFFRQLLWKGTGVLLLIGGSGLTLFSVWAFQSIPSPGLFLYFTLCGGAMALLWGLSEFVPATRSWVIGGLRLGVLAACLPILYIIARGIIGSFVFWWGMQRPK